MLYGDYLKSDHWQKVRKEAIIRAKGRCQLGNEKNTQLNVHHRSYDCLWHETPFDIIVLCEDCHSLFHNKLVLKNGKGTKYLGSFLMAKIFEQHNRQRQSLKIPNFLRLPPAEEEFKIWAEALSSTKKPVRDLANSWFTAIAASSLKGKSSVFG